MIEALWVFLGLVAIRSKPARGYVTVLFVMWWSQVWVLTTDPGPAAEVISVIFDCWGAACCALMIPGWRPKWALLVLWLFSFSFSGQALFWLLESQGHPTDWTHYRFGYTVFTLMMLCVSYPGARLIVHTVLSRIRLGVRNGLVYLQNRSSSKHF